MAWIGNPPTAPCQSQPTGTTSIANPVGIGVVQSVESPSKGHIVIQADGPGAFASLDGDFGLQGLSTEVDRPASHRRRPGGPGLCDRLKPSVLILSRSECLSPYPALSGLSRSESESLDSGQGWSPTFRRRQIVNAAGDSLVSLLSAQCYQASTSNHLDRQTDRQIYRRKYTRNIYDCQHTVTAAM